MKKLGNVPQSLPSLKYLNHFSSISSLKPYPPILITINNLKKKKTTTTTSTTIPIKRKSRNTNPREAEAMVVTTMAWLSVSNKSSHSQPHQQTLQILSFETAKIMSRLVALYKSLSDDEFSKLRNGAMKSKGVTYLNSNDETFLLNLACTEKLEELDSAAASVSRLGKKSSNSFLKCFELVFANLKRGIIDVHMPEFNSKHAEKTVEKIEKFIYSTSSLHVALETLSEMELSEGKLKLRKLNLDPKLSQKTNQAYVEEKLALQRKCVEHYKQTSLWNATFDKSMDLMASIICIIYARICELFGGFVSGLPCLSKENKVIRHISTSKSQNVVKVHPESDHCLLADRHKYIQRHGIKSGPIPKSSRESVSVHPRFYSQPLPSNNPERTEFKNQKVMQLAPTWTAGGAGLAFRYANIIILAESHLLAPTKINDDARGFMYEMLPASLKGIVKEKLWRRWNKEEEEVGNDGHALAQGWRDALEEMLKWLAPMAHDTVQWQAERNMEKQKFDTKRTVLLLQTLFFSDLEKIEAVVAEVLVGLSCIFRYENRRSFRGFACR